MLKVANSVIDASRITGVLPVVNGGTGVTSFGTGVATALGVNTGTAGAFVVNGGALGTPSSGTVTNLTGTASININGTVGVTTPAAGAFTTLSSAGGTNTVPRAFSSTATPDADHADFLNAFNTTSDNALRIGTTASSGGVILQAVAFTASATKLPIRLNPDGGNVTFGGLLFPVQSSSAPSYVKGAIYFDTTLNKLRVGGASGWETITSV